MEADDQIPVRLAAAIRAARARLGWSRETLAHHSGLSWSAITQIETGRRSDVRLTSIVALSNALGVSLDYLVLASGEPAGRPGPLSVHQALVYRSDEELTRFAAGLMLGPEAEADPALVIAPPRKLKMLKSALSSRPAVEYQKSSYWYTTPEEVNDRFRAFLRSAHAAGATWTRIMGEPLWDGMSRSEVATWVRYESLLNMAFSTWPVTFVCLYDARSASTQLLSDVSRTHPEVATGDGVETSATYEAPERILPGPG